jgi:hypothetical protein
MEEFKIEDLKLKIKNAKRRRQRQPWRAGGGKARACEEAGRPTGVSAPPERIGPKHRLPYRIRIRRALLKIIRWQGRCMYKRQ